MITNDFEKLSLKKFKIKSILPDATILCLGKRRCLAKGTVVMMYDGTLRKVEDVVVGEKVMGDDDTPRTVLETANGIDSMYKISHDNGDHYTVNSEHVLCLKNMQDDTLVDMPLKEYTLLTEHAQQTILHGYQKVDGHLHTSPLVIEYVGVDEFYGFLLDSNHRFMLGNGILTHNSGKCIMKGTEILMYDGSLRKVEDIHVGEQVMGDDSTPRTVLETHSGNDTMFTVTHKTGESYTVNSQHILSLKWDIEKSMVKMPNGKIKIEWFDKDDIKVHKKYFGPIHTTKAQRFYDGIDDDLYVDIPIGDFMKLNKYYRRHLCGYTTAVQFPEKILPVDPYTFGGQIAKGGVRVPFEYKVASIEQRRLFLKGLISSATNNDTADFPVRLSLRDLSDECIRDILFVAHSCGIRARSRKKRSSIVITFLDVNVKRLSPITVEPYQSSVDPMYYGIELDGNNRYVLGNFIVTHNSWLVRDIFYHHRHIPSGVVFSGTEEASPFFSDFIPDCFIHSEYDPELIESMMNRQKRKIRETKMSGRSDTGKMPSNNVFIVLDDMLHDAQNWKKEKTIKNIFFNGRHYNFLFILTMQYPLGITPELRSNIDYVFIFNEPSVKNRRKIYDDYAGMIPSFDHFCNILDACTQNHECLVIKTSGNSTDIRDQIFWYKAEPHTKFRVGHDKLWEYHDKRYNEDYECQADEDQAEMDKLKRKFAKTRKLKVIVSRQGDIVGYKDDKSE